VVSDQNIMFGLGSNLLTTKTFTAWWSFNALNYYATLLYALLIFQSRLTD
jgi:hypothetical protein